MAGTRDNIIAMAKETTGRMDLDDTMVSGLTKGQFFLDAALKLLDTKQRNPESRRWLMKDIAVGESVLRFQNCRSIQEVWLMNADGRFQLEKKDIGYIKENYTDPAFTVGTVYTPAGTVAFLEASGTAAPYLLDPTGGLLTAGFEADTRVKVTGSASNNNIYYVTAVTAGKLTFHKNNIIIAETAGSGDVSITPLTYLRDTDEPKYYAPDVIHLAPQQRSLTIADYTADFTYDYYNVMFGNSQGYNGIQIMPPSDVAYTVEVLGDWFSVMTAATDQCYWSIVYPNVLLQAMLFAIEVFYRNATGMRDMLLSLEPFLDGVDKDLVEESTVGINQMEG